MTSLPKLGIIAGNGELPDEIANIYSANQGECFIAFIDEEKSYSSLSKNFSLGSVGAILKYFEDNEVQDVIMVGGITRPDLKSIKPDWGGGALLANILKQKFLGDDNVLKIVSNHIESKGFRVISPKEILSLVDYQEDLYRTKQPSPKDKEDINLGLQVLKSLGSSDVGQSVIVCDGYVLGIEAAEGTDNLIERCSLLRKKDKGGVLVKMSKSSQDMRLDTPVIGSKTISSLVKGGLSGLAIEKNGVLIIKPEKTMKLLNENCLFLEFLL